MNRKLIALFAAGLSCGSLLADDIYAGGTDGASTDSQTFCRIKIDSGRKETVLAIPLTTADGTAALDVTKFVLTTNLKAGDKLGMRVNGKWAYWTLKTDGGTWEAATVADESNEVSVSGKTLSVGDCIKLTRCGKGTDLSKEFYLYGLIPTLTTAQKQQTAEKDAWTMLGNPLPAAVKVSELASKTGATFTEGDEILLFAGSSDTGKVIKKYSYDKTNSRWVYNKYSITTVTINGEEYTQNTVTPTAVSDADVIPAGEGFFFVAKGAVTLNWQ